MFLKLSNSATVPESLYVRISKCSNFFRLRIITNGCSARMFYYKTIIRDNFQMYSFVIIDGNFQPNFLSKCRKKKTALKNTSGNNDPGFTKPVKPFELLKY